LNYIQFNENPVNNREKRLHPFIAESLQLVTANNTRLSDIIETQEWSATNRSQTLAAIFNRNGSDKSTRHSYEKVYAEILDQFEGPKILEIGLGSTNSFPYAGLNPGGSIKSWREFKPSAKIFGADIDYEAVSSIHETGIQVDQTNDASLINMREEIREKCSTVDLIIDDGFHDPHANFRSLFTLFEILSDDGYYVVEDVHASLIDLWLICSQFLPGFMKILDYRGQRPGVEDNILIIFRKHPYKQEGIGV
jgi:hypothetical protein